MAQHHDIGNRKRKHAELQRENATDRSLNTNRMASSLVKLGLASVNILDGPTSLGQPRERADSLTRLGQPKERRHD